MTTYRYSRDGSVSILETDQRGELFVPMTAQERDRLSSLSPAEALEIELAARARTLARPPVSAQPLEACGFHGFVHDSSLAWQRRDIEAAYSARAERSAEAEAARRAADQE